ncbi:Mss4-like protein [Xylaria intraflava]|nr:Mss4-like protein [Xylaria intraflava]
MTSTKDEGLTIVLAARCLCQAHRFEAVVPRSSLPLQTTCCHCTSCRHLTGSLHSSATLWPGDGAAIRNSSLRRYGFSTSLTVLFCGLCGSTLFCEKAPPGGGPLIHVVITGALENVNVPSLLKVTDHMFVGDTLDGGALPWLCGNDIDESSRPHIWKGAKGQGEELSPAAPLPAPEANTGSPDAEVSLRCHCGGVDLILRHPAVEFAGAENADLKWFIDPVSKKSLCAFDACDSCRMAFGTDVFYWTFALLRHLAFPSTSDGDAQLGFPTSSHALEAAVVAENADRDPRLGTLAIYKSSPEVQRFFCSRCSACVFYGNDVRPEMVDVAVGLLHAKEGSRAEGLLSWNYGRIHWQEDAAGGWREEFVESVVATAERWRIERGYPKNWRRVSREETAVEVQT